jgi:diaminopimelate decarboxylase
MPGPWPLTAARDDDGVLTSAASPADLAAVTAPRCGSSTRADLRDPLPPLRRRLPRRGGRLRLQGVVHGRDPPDRRRGGPARSTSPPRRAAHRARRRRRPGRLILHGNNKSEDELDQALDAGVGRIVVDSFEELDRLERLAAARTRRADLAADHPRHRRPHPRVRPHRPRRREVRLHAVARARRRGASAAPDLAHVEVVGHPRPHRLADLRHRPVHRQRRGDPRPAGTAGGTSTASPSPSSTSAGGWGSATPTRTTRSRSPLRQGGARSRRPRCDRSTTRRPLLLVEPGRAIVGPSTITLYEVGTIKPLPGLTTWVSVDGGMSDNIRPALYDAEHEVTLANRTSDAEPKAVTVVGKHCESGDLVREHAPLPGDLAVGDLLAVAATGAYTASMASNYNRRCPRPDLRRGAPRLVRDVARSPRELLTRRETPPGRRPRPPRRVPTIGAGGPSLARHHGAVPLLHRRHPR